ncbi:MAG: IS91 family transposase [Dehalococcoidia bacterium]|nr:MAG: IS91 family transposase [Dehalococcoidia bacterium]
MCKSDSRAKSSAELSDIFNLYGNSYIERNKLSLVQHKAVNAIRNCRTAALGGNVQHCPCCGADIISYNSCRNRHCPKCQALAKAKWLEARQAELLPVEYFHVVFTIPHELNFIAGYNQTLIYNILFKAAWTTIKTLGMDEKRLGGLVSMLAALHTWGQNLLQHLHLHCIIPGGALTDEKWISCKQGFLFPVKVMSKIFRGIFISLLRQAYQNNELKIQGVIADFADPKIFANLLDQLMKKDWCVYSKKPFNGAKGAVDYLAKYVYKTAISNNRILSCDDGKVSFRWRDYSDHNKIKTMTVTADEFIRRFLTHILPDGFMRIRSFGFLANSCKAKNIQQILGFLNQDIQQDIQNIPVREKESANELMLRLTGIDISLCPKCKTGQLQTIKTIPSFIQLKQNKYCDTS